MDMRNAFTVLLLSAIIAMCVPVAHAGPPVDGIYKTQDLDFLEGRYSIAWPGGNSYGDVGNVLHCESWDGASLGTEWRVFCPTIVDTVELYNVPLGGGSYIAGYQITYASGGTIWLDGGGPWGGGDASYTGTIDTYMELRNVQVVAGTLTGLDSNHNLSAHIIGYPADCVTFAIGNSAWIGDTPQHGAKPADYPAYLDSGCGATGTAGHWGTVTDLTLTVEGCEVSTEPSSWGAIKSRYKK